LIQSNAEWRKLFTTQSESEIWKYLQLDSFAPVRISIENYIKDFGERCVGELKLETISYQQNPLLFIKVIQSYVQNNITEKSTSSGLEEKIRKAAELEIAQKVSGWKKRSLLKTMRKARELVSARENLRYERTRAFGIVRAIFSAIGFQFEKKGILQNRRDIFYLSIQEIFGFIEGTAIQEDYQSLVDLRKKEFDRYHQEPAPAQRISTYGTVYQGNKWEPIQSLAAENTSLNGIGCCPGIVQGKVCVVTDPQTVPHLNGNILVTHSTDPGWVTLFPSASGIIVERGSLLSHSAIVSREMGIPCIVSVTGLLQTLKTGDEIKMNGSTGNIEILNTQKE
jgi:pyruvate,water dikinase